MKTSYLLYILTAFLLISCSASTVKIPDIKPGEEVGKDSIVPPKGWKYLGGDEFNTSTLNTNLWSVYGTNGDNAFYGRPQGMLQVYRPEQVRMVTLPSGEKVVRLTSIKRTDGDSIYGHPTWWSGAISTREKGIYFPLYCRMDIRAKVANELGVWHAIWNRYRTGASVAELDINECFVKTNGYDVVNHAIHLWDTATEKTTVNVMGNVNRVARLTDIDTKFYTYSVIIEKDPNAANQAIITYLVDDVVSYSFYTATKPTHNKFIADAVTNKWEDAAWDMVITGQIGSTVSSVGYPAQSLTTAVTELDYFRVFVKE